MRLPTDPPWTFLQLAGKIDPGVRRGQSQERGLAHRRSCSTQAGANVVYVVRSAERKQSVAKLARAAAEIYVCDVEHRRRRSRACATTIGAQHPRLHGLVHSIAFADYADGPKPFHETPKAAFLRSVDISCYSLIALANALQGPARSRCLGRGDLDLDHAHGQRELRLHGADQGGPRFVAGVSGQVVQPVFARALQRRRAGLLKTSASAGIPGYVDAYLYAEQATLRKQAVQTEEVANAAAFLLSPRSSGINAQNIVIDAGMSVNYFDRDLVRRALGDTE